MKDEYISRSAALKAVVESSWAGFRLNEIPAADVRPVVRGKWMQKAEPVAGNYWVLWECSECGYVRTRGWAHTKDGRKPRAYFCERCSAEMMEG